MIEESLQTNPEYANVQDPLVITINASLQETLTAYYVVGHVPREISHVCRYSLIHGSLLISRVRGVRYSGSPITKDILGITIMLVVERLRQQCSTK